MEAWIKEVSDSEDKERGWLQKRFWSSNVYDLETD